MPRGPLVRAPGVVANNGAGVVSNNGVGLSGVVRAPASLVANNGGGLIANNGSGLVANNGGGVLANNGSNYRLLSVEQAAIANATVRVLDANGQPVNDANGAPLSAKTDAQGRYQLPSVVPSANLVLAIDLHGKGELQAIAPRTGGDALTVDIDLVSTLTTSYIMQQYVAAQSDKQQTFNKLPADIEAATRGKAASALARSNVALPTTLSVYAAVDTVRALRQSDASLDAQLETVKSLLLAGGQEDFGSGLNATEVPIKLPSGLLQAPDGTLLIASIGEHRVWQIGSDQRLRPYVGGGSVDRVDLTGVAAHQALLGAPDAMAYDSQGRLVLHESHFIPASPGSDEGTTVDRLLRREANGELKSLFAAEIPGFVRGMFPLPQDGFGWLIEETLPDGNPRFEIWRFDAQGALSKLTISSSETARHLANYPTALNSVDASQQWLLSEFEVNDQTDETSLYLLRLDPMTGQLRREKQAFDGQLGGNATGGHFQYVSGTSLKWVRPDGSQPFPAWPVALEGWPDAAHVTTDGTLYYASNQQIFRVKNNQTTRIAGTNGQPGAGPLALQDLETVEAVAGNLYVIAYGGKVQRLNADRSLTPIAELPGAASPLSGFTPNVLRAGPGGTLFAGGFKALCSLDVASGQYTLRYKLPANSPQNLYDFLPMADGSLYYIATDLENEALYHLAAGSQTPTQVLSLSKDEDGLGGEGALALDAQGRVHLLDHTGKLLRLENGQFKPVVTFNDFAIFGNSSIAFAPDGRLYVPDIDRVLRYDPRLGRVETIAGRGGRFFNGRTPDTSLGWVQDISFNAAGDLFLADEESRQVKQIRASDL